MRYLLLCVGLVLSACTTVPAPRPGGEAAGVSAPASDLPSPQRAADNFMQVVDRVEPVAERICRAQAPGLACDYQIVVDNRANMPANAYQTVDRSGRPIIAFTVALIAEARNQDELAFILGHEAAHHVAGHLPRQRDSAIRGAVLAGLLASLGGAEAAAVQTAQEIGATVGARAYSKEFELEADALGTVIAFRAGFDPERGVRYFNRIQDPGNRFLGSHPPNSARIETVRRTLASLR
ncbi:MAG: M48 family metallopeptidase [Rhodobacter sp.]|nr:M48 family metallopeptidase [Rhodobacter sp.]